MIKRIRIQNFRSIADVTVDLDPLTVLIGRSGTGKSNFVQAIRFLRDLLTVRSSRHDSTGWQRLGRADAKSGSNWGQLLNIDRLNQFINYSVEFTSKEVKFCYSLGLDPIQGLFDESLHVGDACLFHHKESKWIVPPQVRVAQPAPQQGDPNQVMLGAIPGLQESTFAYVALRSGIGCYDFPTDVLAEPWIGGPVAQRHNGSVTSPGLTDSGDNYLAIADQILSDLANVSKWKKITKSLSAVNRAVASLTLTVPTPDRLDVGHQVNGRLLSFDVRQESEGFRRYLAHLLALYQNPSKQTLIFEHPESGLHPGALQSLAEEFKDCPEEGRGQVILTTHSPQLLEFFPVESIRVVDIDHQKTRIDRLAPEQLQSVKEHLLQPGELLTVDPARLPGQLDEVKG